MSLDTATTLERKIELTGVSSVDSDEESLNFLKDELGLSCFKSGLSQELADILIRFNYNILVKQNIKDVKELYFGPYGDLDIMAYGSGNHAYRKSFYENKLKE